MIVREATAKDLRPLLALCRRAWTRLGIRHKATIDTFRKLHRRVRLVVLWDKRQLVAAIGALRVGCADGDGFEVVLLAVDPDRSDRLKLLDAVSLFALNLGRSEGATIALSRRPQNITGPAYGPDYLDMDKGWDDGVEPRRVGDIETMIKAIYRRRPEWRTSL